MLSLLHIENIAVIEAADIEFDNGLTVLTGETGAGKSIIIDSIGAILGQRTSRELIRAGAENGFVSAIFTDIGEELMQYLSDNELEGEDPSTLHIQRRLSVDKKNICRVNMKPVSTSMLKNISSYLINIHGQHDGQKLMNDAFHIDFLDSFAGSEKILSSYRPLYQKLLALKRQITELDKSEQERLQRIDMLTFHLQEIEDAALVPGEEEKLAERKRFFDHAGRLAAALERSFLLLDGGQDNEGVCEQVSVVADEFGSIAEVSPALQKMADRAEEVKYLLLDLRDSISSQRMESDFSQTEQAAVEERLDLIYRLRQKYGESVEAILAYAESCRAELETLQKADERREELREEYKQLLETAKKQAAALSSLRREAAIRLEKRIVSELSELDMTKIRFSVHIETGTRLSAKGIDQVGFLISVNPGESLKPLSKVASGGELSRIMLAIKNVLTEQEAVGTLIFDEIDAGVSGRAAQKIARKLSSIGGKKQTLCVTHLPQIAAIGDHHMIITKNVKDDRTYTQVHPITGDERTAEIARMISGESITDASMKNAAELLTGASAMKKTN